MKIIYLLIFLVSFNLYSSESGIILKNLNNKNIAIDDSIGNKVVLLNFWATWCGPCKKELPIINKLYSKYKDKNFTIISISLDDPSEFNEVRSIAYGLGLNFTILLDPNSKAADYYNPSKNAPFSILYSSNGKKVKTFLGFTSSDEEELEKLIIKEINKKNLSKKPDFSWRFSTLDTYTRYFKDDNNPDFSNYEFLTTRSHLSAFYKKNTILTTFHTNNFLSTTKHIRDKHDDNLSDYRLEKVSLTGHLYNQSYVIGDFHITQGKGIALSINKEDDLGIDTTLQGLNLDLRYKFISLDLFAGFVNNTNLDIDDNTLFEDKRDVIHGATLSFNLLDSIILSTNYNITMFKEPSFNDDNPEPENYKQHIIQILGGNITYNYKSSFKLYLESDYLIDNFYNEDRRLESPYALYASMYYSYKKFVLTQEFKRYKDFRIGFGSDIGNTEWVYARDSIFYNNPATLEREGERVRDVADDIWGTRTNIRYNLSKNIKPYMNYLYSMSYSHNDRRAHHFYIGNEYFFNELKSKIDLSLSLRLEKDTIYNEASKSDTTDNYYGTEFDSTFYMTPYLSLDFKGHYHIMEKSLINQDKTDSFDDIELQTSVTLFKDLFISYMYNRYTFSEEVGEKHNYHSIDAKYRVLNESYIRFFYGSIRGGTKCIGGVCKNYPPFNGFKAEVLVSF